MCSRSSCDLRTCTTSCSMSLGCTSYEIVGLGWRAPSCFTGSAERTGAAQRDRVVEPAGESDSESECMGLARFTFRLWGQLQKEPSIAAVRALCIHRRSRGPSHTIYDADMTPSGALYPSQLICLSTDKVKSLCRTSGTRGTNFRNSCGQIGDSSGAREDGDRGQSVRVWWLANKKASL